MHRFATAEAGIFPTPAPGQFADFTALIDDVRAAVAWASSPDGDVAIRVALMAATAPLWIRSSLYAECRNHVERALASEVLANGHYTRQEMQLSAALAQC
ncbi:MAG: hypothetical protein ACLPKW_14505 [Acetobacteraceae bacterium]